MRQYTIGLSTGDTVEIQTPKVLNKQEAFSIARNMIVGIIDGRPVSFTDTTAQLVRTKQRKPKKIKLGTDADKAIAT